MPTKGRCITAIPQADFDRLVDSVKEEVIEAVREEIAKLPPSVGSTLSSAVLTTAFTEMSDTLLEAVRQELRVFKEELLTELEARFPVPLTPQREETQGHSSETFAEKLKKMW